LPYIDFISTVHKSTKRDYLARVNEFPKAESMKIAKKYDYDFWDGDRKFGYGGYKYDGRWYKIAEAMIDHYGIKPGDTILDVGCGKGFLLYDFSQIIPEVQIKGIDVSEYAIENAKKEVKPFLETGNAVSLPYEDNSFDLVISINALHNLYCYDLVTALKEMERVAKKNKYLVVEAYRNDEEKVNLMYWVLTAECFFTPEEWEWFFNLSGYTGDHSFIYFE
jgi:SAM-dependent methyltransferase